MTLLLKLFFDICTLKAKPQDVPASNALLLLTVALVVVSGVVSLWSSNGQLMQAGIISLLDVALTLVLLLVSLNMLGLPSRLLQTATAIFGSGVILNLLYLSVIWLFDGSPEESGYRLVEALLYFMFLLWSLVIMGHILRHSFNLRLSGGIFIAVAYFILNVTLAQSLLSAG